MENLNEVNVMDINEIPETEINAALSAAPTVDQAIAEASSTFGWREGLVLGFGIVGTGCMLYTGYRVFVAKDGLVRGTIIPAIRQKAAQKQIDKSVEEAFVDVDEDED